MAQRVLSSLVRDLLQGPFDLIAMVKIRANQKRLLGANFVISIQTAGGVAQLVEREIPVLKVIRSSRVVLSFLVFLLVFVFVGSSFWFIVALGILKPSRKRANTLNISNSVRDYYKRGSLKNDSLRYDTPDIPHESHRPQN